MERKVIPLYKVNMPSNMAEILSPVLQSGFITEGPKAKEFECKFQDFIGNKNTALVNSGTSALTLALRLANVGPGSEVISSPLTCLATNQPVLTVGASIVWCDVDKNTGNIDADKIEALITPKTKAILFVDWSGTPAELDKINEVANKHGLKTIEDAAQALGAEYKGRKVGTICDYTTFSFQAIKHLTTVDGGAIACKTKIDYDRAVLLRWFGMSRNHTNSPVCWEGDVTEPGYKMHMNDVNATIGIEQLKYIDGIIAAHKKNGAYLRSNLKGLKNIELCVIPGYIESSFWFFTIKLLSTKHREEVSKKLIDAGVASSITHTRNDSYSLFGNSDTTLPGLDDFGSRMLNIPCGWWVSQEDLDYILVTLRSAV